MSAIFKFHSFLEEEVGNANGESDDKSERNENDNENEDVDMDVDNVSKIMKIIQEAGDDLVLGKDANDLNSLHIALRSIGTNSK